MTAPSRLAPVIALLVIACEQGGGAAPVDVEIVDAAGDNPVEGLDGTIVVEVRHRGELLLCDGGECGSDIVDGDYELRLPLETFEGINEVRVEIEAAGREWIGAAPPFQLFGEGVDITGLVRVVVGEPASCDPLTLDGLIRDEPRLSPARAHAAAVVRRNVVLLAGGEDAGGASNDVDRYDVLTFDLDSLLTWDPETIGPARGHALTEDRSLVVGDASSWLFRFASFGPPDAERLDVHEGAGVASAIVDLEGAGAAVVGGRGSDAIAWIGRDGSINGRGSLDVVRDAPAAAAIGTGVLVVGGHAEGERAVEWVSRAGGGMALDVVGLPPGRGGVLFASPDGADALWIGFEVDGAPSDQTFLLRGCAEGGCEEVVPATWDRPRADFAFVVTEAGTLWLIGGETVRDESGEIIREPSREIDLVRWSAGEVEIAAGPPLEIPRAGAAAFEHAGGVVMVAGGRSAALLDDVEMCFPARLDPL